MKAMKKQYILKASFASLIVAMFFIPSVIAAEESPNRELRVGLGGPFTLNIGEYKTFDYTISGGVAPYSVMFWWGDGSGGNANTHAFDGNKPGVFTVVLTVKDANGHIGVGSARVFTQLSTDNTVTVEKFIRPDNSLQWQKQTSARVGDTLNVKIVIKTDGSDQMNLSIYDESTSELSYVEGSLNLEPDEYYPGEGPWGPVMGWLLPYVEPDSVIEITYDVRVISEFRGYASVEGFAGDFVSVYAYPTEHMRIGPGGFLASDDDSVLVRIKEAPSRILYVNDDGGMPFTHIQDAINAAADGDTVYVYAGTYPEHLEITKSIKLLGQSSLRTIIDGNPLLIHHSIAVQVMAKKVTIQGFTIKNANHTGISVESVNNTISENIMKNNGFEGLLLLADNNMILGNKIMGNQKGIRVESGYNLIKDNTIVGNRIYGVGVESAHYANDVFGNFIMRNGRNAFDSTFNWNHWTGYSMKEQRYIGNYWSDYSGVDADGDGLGDTPYSSIGTGLLVDIYPLMKQPLSLDP